MSYATVLFFDPAMEDAVYTVWDALETVVDQPMRASGIRPHVTLTSGDHIDEGALAAALATFAASTQPFRLTLSSVGLFATGEGVLFFGVTVSRALLELHAGVVASGLEGVARDLGFHGLCPISVAVERRPGSHRGRTPPRCPPAENP